MKKSNIIFFLLVGFFLTSCTNQLEKDASATAKLICELNKFSEKAANGDEEAEREFEKLQAENEGFMTEMERKYPADSSDRFMRFQDIVLTKVGDCIDKN